MVIATVQREERIGAKCGYLKVFDVKCVSGTVGVRTEFFELGI